MQYKGPKYFFFYLTIFVFFLTLFVFQNVAPNQINLGSYSVKDEVSSKMYLNLLNISKIDLEIEDIYTSNQDNLCSTGDIYVYGTLRRSDNLVRIRLQDVKADPSLTINSKSSTIEPTRNYEQFLVGSIVEDLLLIVRLQRLNPLEIMNNFLLTSHRKRLIVLIKQ